MSTYFPSGKGLAGNRKWYVVDAAGQTVGRLIGDGRPIWVTDLTNPAKPEVSDEPIDLWRNDGYTDYSHDVDEDAQGIAWVSGRGGIRGYATRGRHRDPYTNRIRRATPLDPVLVAGGGVLYSGAEEVLAAVARATGIPVAATQAGVGSLLWDHPQYLGGVGATGTTAANALAREADVVIGIGTRWSDFTTASRSLFADPDVRFVNLNVAAVDAYKHAGLPLLADARHGLEALRDALDAVLVL